MSAHRPVVAPPWWQRIRGARSITWQSVVLGNALISAAILATGGTLGGYAPDPDAFARALLVVVVVGIAAAAWAMIGFRVLFRSRFTRPVSLVAYFTYYAINGALYFIGVQWLDAEADHSSGIGWPARLLSSVAISVAWGIALSLLFDSSDRFHARRQQLLDELVNEEMRLLELSQDAQRIRMALDAQVHDALSDARVQLDRALGSGPITYGDRSLDSQSASGIVRNAASDVVRPLSHQLQEQAQIAFPNPRLSGALRQLWRNPRMPPLATALLVSSQTTAESVRNFGGALGPVIGLLYFALLYLFLVGIERAGVRWPDARRPIFVFGVLGSLTMNVVFAEGFSPEAVSVGDIVANVVLSLAYIAVTSIYSAVERSRAFLIDSLTREVDDEDLRAHAVQRVMASSVDTLARELHGRVQTQLVVCAAEVERAEREGDSEALVAALHQAAKALEFATEPQQLTLDDVVSAWDTFMTVSLECSEGDAPSLGRADVVAVVEEGLANAYRHGGATEAVVAITSQPEALRVIISDNGRGVVDAQPGFGSGLLERLSHGRVALHSGPSGATLTVDLPVNEVNGAGY